MISTINIKYMIAGVLVLMLSGCSGYQTRNSSSIYDFLYSEQEKTVSPSTPHINIPINIGVAFVPEKTIDSRNVNAWNAGSLSGVQSLSRKFQLELLEDIASDFSKLDYIDSIKVIPSAYLKPRGGFTNLDQISTVYDVDLIALVSYDQVQFTDPSFLSLSYWTLIGAYFISGEKNDTSTMLDTAVYDIKSRKLLFRALGVSSVKGRSTPISVNEELREDSVKGFRLAAADMKKSLVIELQQFEKRLKEKPETVIVSRKEGYTAGAGSMNLLWVLIIFSMLLMSKICNRKQ